MELAYTEQQKAFRKLSREWLTENVPSDPLPSFDTPEGFEAHRAWEMTLHEGSWSAVTWPKEYGGRGLNLIEWLIFEEEYWRAGAPGRVNQNGLFLLAPTMMEYGSDAQKERFLPPMASGEEIWAQAWSEPGAGSDLAAVKAKATRDGDRYVLNGHKIWSSRAVFADWAFGLFRTDPDSERHRGLSLLLFPLDSDGVRVEPIAQIDGEPGFAEIFLEDVKVPADNLLGGEGNGWSVCMATAGFERGLMLRSPARFQAAAKRLVSLYKENADRLDASVEAAVMQAVLDTDAYCLSIYAAASNILADGSIGPEASCNKIFWSEMDIALHRAALSILGAQAEITAQPQSASWLDGYLFSLAGPIYAGTNEIQKTIIAERVLGMPRK
ncbi:acyl-CoA dehydrogenase family protein [Hyphococcus sp. DH-69]|uniref:acyl-CoA dehydrogenase family protein n=1 Tax=Hyphococcus formosus TaxID=3143534 RepID=UPI00398B59EA